MQKKQKKVYDNNLIKYFFYYLFTICINFLVSKNNIYAYNSPMFSLRLENNIHKLFVVNDNEVFVRTIKNNIFHYEKPKDDCYNLENDVYICTEDGIIQAQKGNIHTAGSELKISNKNFNDEFFVEQNVECNQLKFYIINKLFVLKEKIEGFEMQLYLPEYFSILRLVLFKDENNKDIRAFVISDKNEVGCAFFKDYKIYNNIDNTSDPKKANKKKKKIVAKTEQEFLQKLAMESYKPMLLKGYTYLQPATYNNDLNNIVLRLNKSAVMYVDNVALGLVWSELGYDDLFTAKKIVKNNNDKSTKKKYKKGEVINDKEALKYM